MKNYFLIATMVFSGCSDSFELNPEVAQEIVSVFGFSSNPKILDDNLEELQQHSSEYGKAVSGYIGAPEGFDLLNSIGHINREWKRNEEAQDCYRQSRNFPEKFLEQQIVLSNAAVAGDIEFINTYGKNGFLSVDALIAASTEGEGKKNLVESFPAVAANAKDLRLALIYARMVTRLMERSPSNASSIAGTLERNIIEPSWQELLAGESLEAYRKHVLEGQETFLQVVILKDVILVIANAIGYFEAIGDQRRADKWTERLHALIDTHLEGGRLTPGWTDSIM